MRHSYAVILELDGSRAFDPVPFWFEIDKVSTTPSERVVMNPLVAIQLVQTHLTAGELRKHMDACQTAGITTYYVLGVDADRDMPAGHPASSWMRARFGDVLPSRRSK